ncbi:MAG: hypothetical protein IT522_07960 [Burkholderiales bacterium]|nr:hypothetical protein [Burkholderiales bacterium]
MVHFPACRRQVVRVHRGHGRAAQRPAQRAYRLHRPRALRRDRASDRGEAVRRQGRALFGVAANEGRDRCRRGADDRRAAVGRDPGAQFHGRHAGEGHDRVEALHGHAAGAGRHRAHRDWRDAAGQGLAVARRRRVAVRYPVKPTLSTSAQRVQDALAVAGLTSRIVEYDVPARTSAEAAAVLGCTVAQIAKSLVFRAASGAPVLVIASGASRVDEAKVASVVGEAIGKADAAFVREVTGYAIGGIPPLAHAQALRTLIDRNLLRHETVYAAGGTPHAMFPIAPTDLVRVSGGALADTAP